MTRFQGTEVIRDDPFLWDHFTRIEEYGSNELDSHRRFKSSASKCSDITDPFVSRYLMESGFQVDYPEDREFAIVLSHDIDQVCPSMARSALSVASSLKQMDLAECNQQLFWRLKGMKESPFRNFDEIMDLEAKYDARSSFFFLTEGPDHTKGGYPVETIASDIARVADRGWGIGLHGTYEACYSKEKILKEKEELERVAGRKVIGYRNHYLRFKVPETWRAVSEAGFLYDSTLGYVEQAGFRNGMVHPFEPFDRENGSPIPLLEIPLAIMDDTLFNENKMGLSLEEGWATIERLMERAKECKGVLVVLWHNTTFKIPSLKDWGKMYEKVLQKGKEEGAWLCSADELAEWWLDHGLRPPEKATVEALTAH